MNINPFFFIGAGLSLLLGLSAGLLWMGWTFLPVPPGGMVKHGMLMVCGFLGTLISLERAGSFKGKWPYLAPLLSLIGTGLVLYEIPEGWLVLGLAALMLFIVMAKLYKIQPSLAMATLALGPLCWATGNVLSFFSYSINQIVFWWMAFLFLTIGGERLELSRLMRLSSKGKGIFFFLLCLYLGSLISITLSWDPGYYTLGATVMAFVIWFIPHDIAKKTLFRPALARYVAVAILLGYFWLFLSGFFLILWKNPGGGFHYDALLHTFFLGYVFSMIFGHGPIILPALLKKEIFYSPVLYFPLALLHLSLCVRTGGDLLQSVPVRQWGGITGAISILLFLLTMVSLVIWKNFVLKGE